MSDFHLDLSPLKEPLGFIKLLEWFFSMFVFATCGGYKGATTILVSCKGVVNRTVTAAFAYPFRLNKVIFSSPDPTRCNGTWADFHLVGNFSSSAQFFVTLGVLIFLYCMAALVLYLGYMHVYRNDGIFPMIVFGLLNMILWGGNAWFVYKETSLHKPSNTSQDSGLYPPASGI
ncbi:synaptophysin-like protein 1 isoform X3 [Rhineura floridana]|uniref:synaptophysin-like protein 1 isoform X3 n=1 Tax=Rhineura floridana TaxID=261503 RepID=UPI002AC8086E|nr:synaptophysin-like protein 1 isoform X3 [Rhineura floridana]